MMTEMPWLVLEGSYEEWKKQEDKSRKETVKKTYLRHFHNDGQHCLTTEAVT